MTFLRRLLEKWREKIKGKIKQMEVEIEKNENKHKDIQKKK